MSHFCERIINEFCGNVHLLSEMHTFNFYLSNILKIKIVFLWPDLTQVTQVASHRSYRIIFGFEVDHKGRKYDLVLFYFKTPNHMFTFKLKCSVFVWVLICMAEVWLTSEDHRNYIRKQK